ncbi:hypothetical protein MD484_g4928, partial [Candolleomyces efflorescens]
MPVKERNRKKQARSSKRSPVDDKPWWTSPSIDVNWKAVNQLLVFLSALGLACFTWLAWGSAAPQDVSSCHQTTPLVPSRNVVLWDQSILKIEKPGFKEHAIESLQKAVRIRTDAFDNMGNVGEDPRWDVFHQFYSYLKDRFPLVHANLQLSFVNTHGLFYQWTGTDEDLKPILLAAHQDVVPVDNTTWNDWTHPPYDGYYDGQQVSSLTRLRQIHSNNSTGKKIWGRGSSDDKSQLISILTSVELLLEQDFRPARTVVLAFGFDEEAGGFYGARYLAEYIRSVYGYDGISMIVDEGAGFYNLTGAMLAIPGVTEKGLYNVRIEVHGPGGHSSMPPKHTTIGILAEILATLEAEPDSLSIFARDAVAWLFHDVPVVRSLVPTTKAIDMIHGGVKFNALPESAWAAINHRVSVTSSLGAVQEWYQKTLSPIAEKHGMTFDAFGEHISNVNISSRYHLKVDNATLHGVEPAPFSPSGPTDLPFQLLSGTIKATYNAHRHLGDEVNELTVSPGMMTGNTDTRHYWDLSKHIFRYNHHYGGKKPDPSANGIHTVNEFIEADVLLESIKFFVTLILNADENEL